MIYAPDPMNSCMIKYVRTMFQHETFYQDYLLTWVSQQEVSAYLPV